MAMENPREDLIAYLDGELPDESASQIEKALVADASVRLEVEQLTKTFDLLDLLPSSKASAEFAGKTLTVIRAQHGAASKDSSDENAQSAGRSVFARKAMVWGIRAAALVGLMIAASVGFNSAFRRGGEPIDQLLSEQPLIQRLGEYQEVSDVSFLKQLNESGLFNERDETARD